MPDPTDADVQWAAAHRPSTPDTGPSAPLSPAERVWLREIGMRIRLARVRTRQSQSQFGTRSGVSRVTVGSIERGDHVAALTAYCRLADALHLPLEALLAPHPPPDRPLRLVADGG